MALKLNDSKPPLSPRSANLRIDPVAIETLPESLVQILAFSRKFTFHIGSLAFSNTLFEAGLRVAVRTSWPTEFLKPSRATKSQYGWINGAMYGTSSLQRDLAVMRLRSQEDWRGTGGTQVIRPNRGPNDLVPTVLHMV